LISELIAEDPGAANYMHQILEEEELEYIFARIRLLCQNEGENQRS